MKTILWVDDDINSDALMPFVDELEEDGFNILKANGPDEMYKYLKSNHQEINLIIMDIMMPVNESIRTDDAKGGLNTGYIILENLKESDIYKNIPVLVVSILNDQEITNWSEQHQLKYLSKLDIQPENLCDTIKTIIHN